MDDKKIREAHAAYESGASLRDVATAFSVPRESLRKAFVRLGLSIRTRQERPFVAFNGRKYAQRTDGYWRCTDEHERSLHRDVWEFHNGKIPAGHHIHHKDEDKSNNSIDNLECIDGGKHSRLFHASKHRALPPDRACEACGSLLVRRTYRGGVLEPKAKFSARRFCNAMCSKNRKR